MSKCPISADHQTVIGNKKCISSNSDKVTSGYSVVNYSYGKSAETCLVLVTVILTVH